MIEDDKSEGDEVIQGEVLEGAEDIGENPTKAEEAKQVDEELRQKTGRGARPE